MTKKVKTVLSELRRRLERLYGRRLVQMVLYGSHARGDAEDGSDIDVLVVLTGPGRDIADRQRRGGTVARPRRGYQLPVHG